MARTPDPAAIVVEQENLIQGVAKHFLQKVYGAEGMPWGTKFSALEELAVQIGQAVSRSMMDQALANQAQNVPEAAETCGVCGETVRSGPRPEPRAMATTVGQVCWEEPERYCPRCRAAFFPQSRGLGIDQGTHSPHVLRKIVHAGSQNTSFAAGSENLHVLAGLNVPVKQVERLTKGIGRERVAEREAQVEAFLELPLMGHVPQHLEQGRATTSRTLSV